MPFGAFTYNPMNYSENETESFYDQRLDFTYDGRDYIWYGDYKVETSGDPGDNDVPAYYETEVEILETNFCTYYDETTDEVVEVEPTRGLLCHIEIIIERNL
jgi:hypothetical protein